jgi:hypothetical protein
MRRVLGLKACDFPGMTLAEALPMIDITDDYHRQLKSRMEETRINLVPILVKEGKRRKKDALGNGHHRVKIAFELGHERMNITDDDDESGWDEGLDGVII